MLTITLVIKIASAVANFAPSAVANILKALPKARTAREETMMPRIPIPEMGLAEVPMRPAI